MHNPPDWSPPPELAGPLPRRTAYPLVDQVTSALMALAFVVFAGLPVSGYLAARDLAALKAQGVPVEGVVTELTTVTHHGSSRIGSGGSGTTYGVEYRYSGGAGGQTYTRSTGLGTSDYAALKVGGAVPVVYDRAAPQRSVLGFETAPFPSLENVMALELLFCGLALIFGFGLWRKAALHRRQKKLLMWGQAAQAVISESRARETTKAVYTAIKYSFIDAQGQTLAASADHVHLKKSGPAGVPATVLFDPKNSANHALYPFRPTTIAK